MVIVERSALRVAHLDPLLFLVETEKRTLARCLLVVKQDQAAHQMVGTRRPWVEKIE